MTTARRTSIDHNALVALQSTMEGAVIVPDDPGYDQARANWNLAFEQYPAVIVAAANASDVQQAVQFANAQGLPIAVKATGHGVIRPADDCLLIVTGGLQGVEIDAARQTARVQAGVQWSAVLERAQQAGLAPLLGSSPTVGVVGYTLGGGMGWLARQYGLAVDSVIAFHIVTPDGQLVWANADEHSDLYWALRGGGGNFGVVVELEFRLHPVTTVYAGNLYYPAELAREVYTRYREWVKTAPEALTSGVILMNYPPMPIVPEFLRGQSFVQVRGCYTGPVAEGEALLAYWRDWQTPVIDDFRARPFAEAALISNDPTDPIPAAVTNAWLNDIDDATIETLASRVLLAGGPPALLFAEIRHAGGAIARSNRGETAFSLRDGRFSLEMVGIAPTPEAHEAFRQHTDGIKGEIASALTGGVYLNFTEGEEARRSARRGFSPEAYERLRRVKAQYDPANRFAFSYDLLGEDL